jgi:hypothetical protein
MDGMAGLEPRTFRNWQAIAYFGVGTVGFAIAGPFAGTTPYVLAVLCSLALLAVTRQHVIVYADEVEIHYAVRHRRLALLQVDRLSVLYTSGHTGWRIRLHCGQDHVDTSPFLNLTGFRFSGAAFAAPPPDAPPSIKELYALLSVRMGSSRHGRDDGVEVRGG